MFKHKRAILTIAAIMTFGSLYLSVSTDYDTCRANGNSISQCTGRG